MQGRSGGSGRQLLCGSLVMVSKSKIHLSFIFLLILLFVGIWFNQKKSEEFFISGGCDQSKSSSLRKEQGLLLQRITYCEGEDRWTGDIVITTRSHDIDIATSGYIDGQRISLRLENEGGESLNITPPVSGERWVATPITIPPSWKLDQKIKLVLSDNSEAHTGWGGVAINKTNLLNSKFFTLYSAIFLMCAVLILPGLVLSKYYSMGIALLFIPGILLLSFIGLIFWITPSSFFLAIKWFFIGSYIYLLIIGAPIANKVFKKNKWYFLILFLTFTQAILIGINPLPVAQESYQNSSIPSRMVASPPDHIIPYMTAAYFFHKKDGTEDRRAYFGDDWSVASRGPLVPLGVNALLHLFNQTLNDPPNLSFSVFPLGEDGTHFARMYGWLLNALVILGAARLLSVIGVTHNKTLFIMSWLALSPVVLINTVFLWPKLLATFFILLSFSDVLEKRHYRAGAFLALAWLSHPVGALFFPIFAFLIFIVNLKKELRHSTVLNSYNKYLNHDIILNNVRFFLSAGLVMLPWLAYKIHVGHHDVLFEYFFGDGRGTKSAVSFLSWLSTRWSNFWITLSPAAFYYSPFMMNWADGPLRSELRWTIQNAKTLPGQIGFVFFFLACAVSFNFKNVSTAIYYKIFISFFWVAFLWMLLFWGFSSDGLGRNCLEPLSVFVIIFSGVTLTDKYWFSKIKSILIIALLILFTENRWVEFSGYYFHKDFSAASVTYDGIFYFILSSVISFVFLIIGIKSISVKS
jgi:hypothetical protein